MTIPSVVMCCIHSENKKFDGLSLNDAKGKKWLETVKSFRYEPLPGRDKQDKPFTVRKESTKSGDYWYGYRKMGGRLHKKYIGKTSEINTPLLDSIGEDLNTPPSPRVTDRVAEVTDRVTDNRDSDRLTDRLTTLESQVQALQESLEALRNELPGKSDAGNFEELPTVTDSELQIELGNLKAENEKLQSEYTKLLSSSQIVTEKLREEVREVRSQLEQERADREEVEAELRKAKDEAENSLYLRAQYHADLIALQNEHKKLQGQLSDLKQNSESEFDSAGKAGELVSWLRKEVGKALPKQVTVKAVQKILEGEQ